MRATAVIVLLGLLALAGGTAHSATGQRAGCMVANILFRRPVTLHLSTTPLTWSVRCDSSFLLLDTEGHASSSRARQGYVSGASAYGACVGRVAPPAGSTVTKNPVTPGEARNAVAPGFGPSTPSEIATL